MFNGRKNVRKPMKTDGDTDQYSGGVKVIKNDQYGRRKWVVDDKLIQERNQRDTQDPQPKDEDLSLPQEKTEFLQSRKYNLELKANLGKVFQMGVKNFPGVGKKTIFECEVCEVTFNDSITYMDHLNGKRHNRLLGMNMKVEKVSTERVLKKLEMLGGKNEKAKIIDEDISELRKRQHDELDIGVPIEDPIEVQGDGDLDSEGSFDENGIPEEERAMMEAMGIPVRFGK
jgi:U4/U6.U5 tri-snRNP component SNU23